MVVQSYISNFYHLAYHVIRNYSYNIDSLNYKISAVKVKYLKYIQSNM